MVNTVVMTTNKCAALHSSSLFMSNEYLQYSCKVVDIMESLDQLVKLFAKSQTLHASLQAH